MGSLRHISYGLLFSELFEVVFLFHESQAQLVALAQTYPAVFTILKLPKSQDAYG